jgi:hypothetical protein
MQKRRALGLLGSILLIVASFSSILRVPVLGGAEGYLYPGLGSIVIVLALGITALILTLRGNYKSLLFIGIVSLLTMLLLYIYADTTLSKARDALEAKYLASNPAPEGFGEILTAHPIEFMFGTVLLIAGAVLTIVVAAIKRE